jgi:hypothetical protein
MKVETHICITEEEKPEMSLSHQKGKEVVPSAF